MSSCKFLIPLVLALIATGVLAEDKEVKLHGTVNAKPADAKGDVVAVLTVPAHRGAEAAEAKKYNLLATGEIAKQVTALVGKKAEVTGTESADGVKVTAIKEATPHHKKDDAAK